MLVAQRKLANAQQSLREAEDFLDLTRKQERGGEVARADVVKAADPVRAAPHRHAERAARSRQGAHRVRGRALPRLRPAVLARRGSGDHRRLCRRSPTFRRAPAAIIPNSAPPRPPSRSRRYEITSSSRRALSDALASTTSTASMPTSTPSTIATGYNQLGSVAQAQFTIPVWNWGATRSRIRQSEFRLQQASTDLSFTQRQMVGEPEFVLRRSRTRRVAFRRPAPHRRPRRRKASA